MPRIEVFADITCPFTHVGLTRVADQLAALGADAELIVRAWPLEWVNGEVFTADAVAAKITVLSEQLGVEAFAGFDPDTWPRTSIPALGLCAEAARAGAAAGLAMALDVRAALFERGADITDERVLATLADRHGLASPSLGDADDPHPDVVADYTEGRRRGVRGSPDFWVGETEYFCPALDLSHDESGHLVAHFDPDGLADFVAAAVA